jgi:hypothetical protein
MDFTIRLRAEGTAETRAQADAVKAVRTEIGQAQARSKIDVAPKNVDKLRALSSAASSARSNLARLEAERKNLNKGGSVNIAQKRDLDRRIEGARSQVASTQSSYLKAGGAAFDVRGYDKAQKEEISAIKRKAVEVAKAAKIADEEQALKIDPSRRKKSSVEKATENVKKEKEQSLAEKIDPSLKKLSVLEKAKDKFFGGIAKGAILAGGVAGAALIGVASKLAPLALGYAGMARLSMISAQASFNMRRLFTGTNPKPLLDALQRTSQLIDPRTFTGKALGDMLVRSSNGFFNMLAKAEPYARLFFKGMLLGALQVEGAWLKLQIAIQPAIALFPKGTGLMTAFSAGALAVKSAFALMGVGIVVGAVKTGAAMVSFGASALAATAPLLPFVAAVVALAAAYDQAIKLKAEWDENSATQIKNKLKEDFGFTTQAERDEAFDKRNKSGKYYVDKPDVKPVAPTPKNAEKQAATAGPPIGRNLGLGMLAGMKDMQGKVEAGGRDLVLAAEGGAKAEAEIKSPAAKWRREIGRQLGAGAALGLMDSADKMDEAGRAAIPDAPSVGGFAGGKRGGVVIQQIGPFFGVGADVESLIRRIVPDVIDDMAERIGALAN